MQTTQQILEALSQKFGGASAYRLAKILNASSETTVKNWLKGRSFINDAYATRIAELLELPPAYVVACIEHDRLQQQSEAARAAGRDPLEDTGRLTRMWKEVAEVFKDRAAIPALAMFALLAGANVSEARQLGPNNSNSLSHPSIHYANYFHNSEVHVLLMRVGVSEMLRDRKPNGAPPSRPQRPSRQARNGFTRSISRSSKWRTLRVANDSR
jgi:hypothetical protein